MNTESLKGKPCPYRPITCQEGFCQNCQIFKDYQGHERTMGRESVVVGKWHRNNEVCLRCGTSRTALREMIAQGDRSSLTIANHILEGCPACEKALGGKQ